MRLPIDVLDAVVAHIRPIDAGDITGVAVAPIHKQRITLFPSGIGHIIGRKRKLIRIASLPSVGDFGGTLVGRLGGKGKAKEKTYDEQKFTLHCSIL